MPRASRYGLRLRARDDGSSASVEFIDGRVRPPRDAAIELLCAAAEIEHGMAVQYAYGAYSVDVSLDDDEAGPRHAIRDGLASLARARLGALISVQRLLALLGVPAHLERNLAMDGELFPVRFRLEPVSSDVLAKYLIAERPEARPADVDESAWFDTVELEPVARRANDGVPLRPLVPLYDQLRELFGCEIDDATLTAEVAARDRAALAPAQRAAATGALAQLAACTAPQADRRVSRMATLCSLHALATAVERRGERVAHLCVTDPRTAPPRDLAACGDHPDELVSWARESGGYLHDDRARGWAQLFNARYRVCLAHLAEYVEASDAADRVHAMTSVSEELRRMRMIGSKLASIRLEPGPLGATAGAPFELPHSLALGRSSQARWRAHLDLARASAKLAGMLLAHPADRDDPFLHNLAERDATRLASAATGHAEVDDIDGVLAGALHGDALGTSPALDHELYLTSEPVSAIGPDPANVWAVGNPDLVHISAGRAPVQLEPSPLDEADLSDGSRSRFELYLSSGGGGALFRASERELLRRLEGIDPDDRDSLLEHGPRLLKRLRAGTLPHPRAWPTSRVEAFANWLVCELTDEG